MQRTLETAGPGPSTSCGIQGKSQGGAMKWFPGMHYRMPLANTQCAVFSVSVVGCCGCAELQ